MAMGDKRTGFSNRTDILTSAEHWANSAQRAASERIGSAVARIKQTSVAGATSKLGDICPQLTKF